MPPRSSESSLILVADDEASICGVIHDILTDEGYRVHCAADGQEALDQVEREAPDLLVSDVNMPRLGGVELVRRLRAIGHLFPVLLISANRVVADLPNVRFLAKPFDLSRLLEEVVSGLRRRQA
jgi:CheY-like chemotaxis protein